MTWLKLLIWSLMLARIVLLAAFVFPGKFSVTWVFRDAKETGDEVESNMAVEVPF